MDLQSRPRSKGRPSLCMYVEELKKRLEAVEKSNDELVVCVEREEKNLADRYVKIVSAKDDAEQLEHELREVNEQLKSGYLAAISVKSEKINRLRLYRNICLERWNRIFPGWIKKMQYAYRIIREEGYDNRTRWRGSLVVELTSTLNQVIDKYGHKLEIVYNLRDLIFKVNAYNRDQLTDILKRLRKEAIELEAEKDEYFRNMKADYDLADRVIKELERSWATLDVKDQLEAQDALHDRLHVCRRVLDEERGPPTVQSFASTVTRQHLVKTIDKERWFRSTDSNLHHQYSDMLLKCTSTGDYTGALLIYQNMIKWRWPIREATFRQIIKCCKQSRPVRSDIAVEVLKDMRLRGIQPDVSIYNVVLSCCLEGRHWRRALRVYKSMMERQVMPNTNTYRTLLELGKTAHEEPAVIYDAMKYVGVPVYLAYSAASANAQHRKLDFSIEPTVDDSL